ncbi:MAG: chitobiase/beta-hexosaminidase C-terminal domain-containing protein [Myxococcaceae bacterium]
MRRFAFAICLVALSCGSPPKVNTDGPEQAAHTSVSPDPGTFNDRVAVSLTTDIPATIFVTTDGSDPAVEGANRKSGPSPLGLELTKTTTLKFFSKTDGGAVEPEQTVSFVRAGGVKGTISGVVVIDTIAVGHALALSVNGAQQPLTTPVTAMSVPFKLENQPSGTYRLTAISDRDGDGNFVPVLDLFSNAVTITLDLNDPFKASAEDVKLFIGASAEGLCTLQGTVTMAKPPSGQSLSIAALSPSSLGGGADPQALLGQLQSGYQVFTNSNDTTYAYAITDLKPGSYIPAAILSGFGNGGLAMNFLANPLQSITCNAGETKTKNFSFGGVGLTGTATFTPPGSTDGGTTADGGTANPGFVYGVVAAKSFNFSEGLEAVLMPTLFAPNGNGSELAGNFGGTALRENASFGLRAFPSTDAQQPLTAALAWIVAIGGAPAHKTVNTQSSDVTADFSF